MVCEAFVGNVILKLYEGVGATLISKVKEGMLSSLRSKIGALLVEACAEGDAQVLRRQQVRRSSPSGPERPGGEDPR